VVPPVSPPSPGASGGEGAGPPAGGGAPAPSAGGKEGGAAAGDQAAEGIDAIRKGLRAEQTSAGSETAGGDGEVASKATEASLSPAELLRIAVLDKYARMRAAPLVREDWAKGMFGGLSSKLTEFGERKLIAAVRKIADDWFEVALTIESGLKPATDAVFFLHNTFSQPTPTVGFDDKGVARLTVSAWGAFTVGVLMDDGSTELELDLSEVSTAPALFRNR
jgi:hypothetical protein